MAGTLLANASATALVSLAFLLQRVQPLGSGLSLVRCQALQGIEDGFCGSLSTVSTFVVELEALVCEGDRGKSEWKAWAYGAVSVCLGIALVVLVLGSGWWSRGLGPVCSF